MVNATPMLPAAALARLFAVEPGRPAAEGEAPMAEQMHHPVYSPEREEYLREIPEKLAKAQAGWLNVTPFDSLKGHVAPPSELPMLGMFEEMMRTHNLHVTKSVKPSVAARMWQTFFYDRTFYLLKYSNPHLFKLFADVPKDEMSLTCLLESYAVAVAGAGQSDKSEFTIGEAGSLCKMGLERRATFSDGNDEFPVMAVEPERPAVKLGERNATPEEQAYAEQAPCVLPPQRHTPNKGGPSS